MSVIFLVPGPWILRPTVRRTGGHGHWTRRAAGHRPAVAARLGGQTQGLYSFFFNVIWWLDHNLEYWKFAWGSILILFSFLAGAWSGQDFASSCTLAPWISCHEWFSSATICDSRRCPQIVGRWWHRWAYFFTELRFFNFYGFTRLHKWPEIDLPAILLTTLNCSSKFWIF